MNRTQLQKVVILKQGKGTKADVSKLYASYLLN